MLDYIGADYPPTVRDGQLGARLAVAYEVRQAPVITPDPARGASLYAHNCSICHGDTGQAMEPWQSNPDRIPMRIIPHPLNQTCAHRVQDDVPRHSLHVLFSAQRPVMKPLLPKPPISPEMAVDGTGAVRLHPAHQRFQAHRPQLDQPVEMIMHYHPG
ncbi:hypothetical protein BR1R5_05430 [Pseudomonas sp. BR1R-5]|nr:hypothetical protein BR1R5_05430 [Pseudomonas sp. BR1R-5]